MSLLSRIAGSLLPHLAHVFAILLCTLSLALLLIFGAAHLMLARMADQYTPIIERELSRILGRAVRIGSLHVDGFSNLVLADSAVAHGRTFAAGVALSVPRTTARLNLFTLLQHRGMDPMRAIEQVELRQPVLSVKRDAAGHFDFADVLDRLRGGDAAKTLQTRVLVTDGAVTYRDVPVGVTQRLAHVEASLRPGGDGMRFAVSGRDPQHRADRIRLAGTYRPAEGRARVRVRAEQLDVKLIAELLPWSLPITFEDGTAALRLSALLTNLPTPADAQRSPRTALTAEVDLRGVGLRLDELTTPIMATSGRLRLTHDPARYPQGSRLELLKVKARARDLPLTLSGSISELDLRNLPRLTPVFDVRVRMATRDGEAIARLFPSGEWVHAIALDGPATLDARITGQPADLRIAGTLASRRFTIRGLAAEQARASFTLAPADPTTLSAEVAVRRLWAGDVALHDVMVAVSSTTPWRQLEKAPALAGTVRAARARLPWFTLPDLAGEVVATADGITLSNVRTTIFSGSTTALLRIPFASPDVLRADATFAGMNLARLSRAFRLPSLSGHLDGHLALRLLPDGGASLEMQVQSTDAAYAAYEASRLNAVLRIDRDGDRLNVTIPRADARTAYGDFTATQGVYRREAGAADALTMALRGARIPLAIFGDDAEYGGYAELDGTLSGDPLAPTLAGAVTVKDGMLLGRAFAEGTGQMTYRAGGALRFRDVVLTRPGMRLEMAGGADGFDPRDGMVGQEGTLTLQGAPLADVLGVVGLTCPWRVDGGTRGTVALRVGEHGLIASGAAFIPDAVVHVPHGDDAFPLDLRRVALDFAYADRIVQVRNLQLERGDTLVTATGTAQCPVGGALSADLTYQAAGAALGDIPHALLGLPVALSGAAHIHGTLRGDLNGEGETPLTVTATAAAPRFAAAGVPLGAGDLSLTYAYRPEDRQVTFDHLTVENTAFTARGSGRYLISRGEVDDLEITVDPLRVAKLPALLTEMSGLAVSLPADVAGTGLLRLWASGPIRQPTLRAEVALQPAP
ncbi:MAG TPA: hypothetical protein PLZ36_10415, partial [Armatimonadota bacterium]|nr:hypothetical protein [Armatimonadota bacterium]